MQMLSVLLVLGVSAIAMTTPAASGYRLLGTLPIAGDDGWDHPTVDSAARRLYVTHGTHVVVVDIDSGKLVGKIDNTPGVHFTVIDPELDRGFISNGGAARLTIFNTKTLETVGEVKSTGENPGPTVFDPATRRVFTFNLNSHNATVVDFKGRQGGGRVRPGRKAGTCRHGCSGQCFCQPGAEKRRLADRCAEDDRRSNLAGRARRWPADHGSRPKEQKAFHWMRKSPHGHSRFE